MVHTAELEAAQTREMLTFRLGSEAYGINILKVQEIRGCDPVTPIAGTPEFIRGVIDLRGVIVPIVDMRMKFALSDTKYDASTVVIILNVGRRVIGIVVDAVSDVVTLPPTKFGRYRNSALSSIRNSLWDSPGWTIRW